MRRLSTGDQRSRERGAVSVIVALLMVPLIGFAALSVDVAGTWARKQQIQTGADAAALAVAQDCAKGACGSPTATAQALATANLGSGSVSASLAAPVSTSSSSVTVRTSSVRSHFFAPVLGISSSTVSAQSTVRWGSPLSGTAALPLAFNLCEFLYQTGGGLPSDTTLRTVKLSKTSATSCTGHSNLLVAGGFGWLATTGPCTSKVTVGTTTSLFSEPGNSPPSSCSPSSFTALRNATVLLPIFDDSGGSGSGAYYHLYAFAAFKITGYYFAGQYTWNNPCNGNERCIQGYFTRFVDLTSAFTYGSGPQTGASVVALTK